MIVAQTLEQVAEPTRVGDGDVLEELLILAAVIEIDYLAIYLLDEVRLLKVLRLVAAAREEPARLSESTAQIADDVT